MPEPKILTAGGIAAELGVPIHRVEYVLRTRKHIVPAARAGTMRLFHLRTIALVRHELNAIEARRCRGAGVAHD